MTITATAAAAAAAATVTTDVGCLRLFAYSIGLVSPAAIAAKTTMGVGGGGVCLRVTAYPVQVAHSYSDALYLAADTTAGLLSECAILYIQVSIACTYTGLAAQEEWRICQG